jgi:hypothetical protein
MMRAPLATAALPPELLAVRVASLADELSHALRALGADSELDHVRLAVSRATADLPRAVPTHAHTSQQRLLSNRPVSPRPWMPGNARTSHNAVVRNGNGAPPVTPRPAWSSSPDAADNFLARLAQDNRLREQRRPPPPKRTEKSRPWLPVSGHIWRDGQGHTASASARDASSSNRLAAGASPRPPSSGPAGSPRHRSPPYVLDLTPPYAQAQQHIPMYRDAPAHRSAPTQPVEVGSFARTSLDALPSQSFEGMLRMRQTELARGGAQLALKALAGQALFECPPPWPP